MHNLNFVYSPLNFVEHNYANDYDYNKKLEDLMNLKNNITNLNQNMNVEQLDYGSIVMKYFEANIGLQKDKYPVATCVKVMVTS